MRDIETTVLQNVVGRLHVGEPARNVVRAIKRAYRPAAWRGFSRAERRRILRKGLRIHEGFGNLYRDVMGGIR